MKLHAITFIAIVLVIAACQPRSSPEPTQVADKNTDDAPLYDSVLAKQLQADAFGMRRYVMAFLKAGPNQSQDSVEAVRLQRAHLDNIQRLAAEGKLSLAGPFLDNGDIRGIYIFNVERVEEAEALTRSDPAIQAGRLVMELHPWYGSAALQQVNDWHAAVAKKKI